ncbi:preprotein translocase subunit SecE [Spiroplasma endosymbiont of Megaselia nigra]|uniref:preprotein translocase subunit SecE n=1 Tax=Spiroplasma endosymbiont of Megaselia nigra TaxID=2478537 RepID=UPI000F87DFC1|nr:preprotein translocase subunit SecE [Spiroplasma endosymbiont of Megaselia nigra]RUO86780.1 preprotein translocase subunit SecE [Spiroplasma endosymbiont of Megaselia nigra]
MKKNEKSKKNVKTVLTKEEKKALKVQNKNEKSALIFQKKASKTAPIQVGTKKVSTTPKVDENGEPIKKGLFKRKNSNKSKKTNWKLAFREFPVKMAKEVTRIRWTSKGSLGRKFLITILFIIAFAVFYLVLDLVLHHLLTVARII